MKQKQHDELIKALENIDGSLETLRDYAEFRNWMFASLVICAVISLFMLGQIALNLTPETNTSDYLDEGIIDVISEDVVVMNGNIYDGICSSSTEKYRVGDYVKIKKSGWDECDRYYLEG